VWLALAVNRSTAYQPGAGVPEDEFEEFDSPETVAAIADTIRGFGHRVEVLEADRSFPSALAAGKFDFVFNVSEGLAGRSRESQVPAVCDMLGIPFSGSDAVTMGITLDKDLARRAVAGAGASASRNAGGGADAAGTTGGMVRVAPGRVFRNPDRIDLSGLTFPIFAKPNSEGSSKGIRNSSRITSEAEAKTRIAGLIREYQGPVLVEEFLPGCECTIGVLGNSRPRVLGIMEIAPKKVALADFVYSLETKRDYLNQVEYHVPPRLPAQTIAAIENTVLAAYERLGCRDFARIDVRLDGANVPHFLEANPLPGLSPVKGDLVILAKCAGMEYRELIGRILDLAFIRTGLASKPQFSGAFA